MRSGSIESKPGCRTSGDDFRKENNRRYFSVNTRSPSSKLGRISLLKQPKTMSRSPSYRVTIDSREESEEDFGSENESPPPLKSRRISVSMKTQSPGQNNCKKWPASACKELMKLALTRGSLDDITVMIIDLYHFTCHSLNP